MSGSRHPLEERLDRILRVRAQRCRFRTVAERQPWLWIAVRVRRRCVERERALAIGYHIVVRANARRALGRAPPPVRQQLITQQDGTIVALEPWPPTDARFPHAQVVSHVAVELRGTHELDRKSVV